MKIICASCHKKFDNDKYYGICPKCGAFNRINYSEEEDHKRFHEMYDDTNGHSEYGKHEHYHEEYDDTKAHADVFASTGRVNTTFSDKSNGRKTNKGVSIAKIIWIIIIASFLLNFFGGIFMTLYSQIRYFGF